MGGMVKTGVSISCDRCKKQRPVTDEAQVAFYEKFGSRTEKSEMMCAALITVPGGEQKNIAFEWLCPDCALAISGYFEKVEPPKAREPKPTKDPLATEAKDSPAAEKLKDPPLKVEEKPEPKAKAKPEAKKEEDEPDRDALPAVSDNELFDDM